MILVHDFWKSKLNRFWNFVQNNLFILFLSISYLLISSRARLAGWDEFGWASFVKHLVYSGQYWNSSSAILEQSMRYFPGVSIWESFFCGQNQYTEGSLFFSQGLIYIASCKILIDPLPNLFKKTLALVAFISMTTWFSSGLTTVYVDCTMGLLLGLALLAGNEVKKPQDLIVSLVLTSFLAISKETGLALALVCLLFLALRAYRLRILNRVTLSFFASGMGLMALNFLSWKFYLLNDPGIQTLPSRSIVSLFVSDLTNLSSRTRETLTTLYQSFFEKRTLPYTVAFRNYLSHREYNALKIVFGLAFISLFYQRSLRQALKKNAALFAIGAFVFLVYVADPAKAEFYSRFIGSYVFWAALLGAYFIHYKTRYELVVTYFLGLIGYTILLFVTYLYIFGAYEGTHLASYERYLGVYFLAFSILALGVASRNELFKNRLFIFMITLLIWMFPPSLTFHFPFSLRDDKVSLIRDQLKPISALVNSATPDKSRIWFIFQNSDGFEAMMVRYEIMPRRMNMGLWSVGEKYAATDVWTAPLTPVEFFEEAKKYNFIAVGRTDEKFNLRYGHLFKQKTENNTLYKITDGVFEPAHNFNEKK